MRHTRAARSAARRTARSLSLTLLVAMALAAGAAGGPAGAGAGEGSGGPALGAAGTRGFTIHDEETVYVTGDASGAPRDVVVVDWLKLRGTGSNEVLDPGPVTAAEALIDDLEPRLTREGVVWSLSVDGARDFFYRAETDKELPVEVSISYELDGAPVPPEELDGANGRLRIEVTVTNRIERTKDVTYTGIDGVERSREATYSAPLLAPVKIDVDGRIFTSIDAEPEIRNITGSMVSHTFMTFPQPSQTVVIEMDGTDIELEPTVVSVFPKLAGKPDFSVTDGLGELYERLSGLEKLSRGHAQVLGGMAEGMGNADLSQLSSAGAGLAELRSGLEQLEASASDLGRLTEGHIAYLDGVIDGLRAQDYSQVAALPAALGSLSEGVAATKGGVDGLVGLLTGQVAYLDAISASNGELLDRASALAAASPDTTTTALVAGLTRQRMMLTALRDGDADLGLPMGLADTRDSLQEVSAGLGEIAAGLRAIAEGAAPLAELPVRFGTLASALETLRDGGAVAGRTMPGLATSSAGLAGVASGISAAGDGVGAAGEGLALLSELPEMLGELRSTLLALEDGGEVAGTHLPGVSTTAEALGEASSGLLGGLNDAEFGKEVVELMEHDVGGYDTFLGKPEGATGDVRFVFKFDAVRKAEE